MAVFFGRPSSVPAFLMKGKRRTRTGPGATRQLARLDKPAKAPSPGPPQRGCFRRDSGRGLGGGPWDGWASFGGKKRLTLTLTLRNPNRLQSHRPSQSCPPPSLGVRFDLLFFSPAPMSWRASQLVKFFGAYHSTRKAPKARAIQSRVRKRPCFFFRTVLRWWWDFFWLFFSADPRVFPHF